MKRRRERTKHMRALRLWDHAEVTRADPYLHSIVGSLREHWLELLSAQRQLDRSDRQKGLAKRQQIIEKEIQNDERQRAQDKFEDALAELNRVDGYLLDPVKGLAVIPFRKEEDLAWYVFDHFAQPGVVGWRLHDDPIEACRPLNTLDTPIVNGSIAN